MNIHQPDHPASETPLSLLEHLTIRQLDPAEFAERLESAREREAMIIELARLQPAADQGSQEPATREEIQELELALGLSSPAQSDSPDPANELANELTLPDRISLRYLDDVASQSAPEAVVVAGQSGSGKSLVTENVCRYFADRGQCVVVDPREIVWQLDNRSESAADIDSGEPHAGTLARAEALAERIAATAIGNRQHLVIESRCGDHEQLQRRLKTLCAAGYRTTLVLLCVPPDISFASSILRYEFLMDHTGVSRFEDLESHLQQCSDLQTATLAAIDASIPDELIVLDRSGNLLWIEDQEISEAREPVDDLLSDVFADHNFGLWHSASAELQADQETDASPETPIVEATMSRERSRLMQSISQMAAYERGEG